jgi:very-short-patch-repair endonuclease
MFKNPKKFTRTAVRQDKRVCVTIGNCFNAIEASMDKSEVVTVRLKWINEILQSGTLNAIHVTEFFHRLAMTNFFWWEPEQTFHAEQMLASGISILLAHLKKQSERNFSVPQNYSNPHYTLRELCEILNALSKLPIKWKEASNMTIFNVLLKCVSKALKSSADMGLTLDLLMLAGALSKLPFSLKHHEELIEFLLSAIEVHNIDLLQQDRVALSQAWQYLAVLQTRHQKLGAQLLTIFEQLELQLAQDKEIYTQLSQSQLEATQKIKTLCSEEALEDLKIEYSLGSYSMDIAFPKHKLNIEIDGKHHYLSGNELRFSDQVRDFVLNKIKGFYVLRIQYVEWCELLTEKQRITYLRDKLKSTSYESILKTKIPCEDISDSLVEKQPSPAP